MSIGTDFFSENDSWYQREGWQEKMAAIPKYDHMMPPTERPDYVITNETVQYDLNGGDSVVVGNAVATFNQPLGETSADNGNRKWSTVKQKSRIEALEARINAMMDEVQRLKSRPEEPDKDVNIVYFTKQFTVYGKVYSYAAIKAAGLWYTTGPRAPKAYSWDELLDFIDDDDDEIAISVVTELTPLV